MAVPLFSKWYSKFIFFLLLHVDDDNNELNVSKVYVELFILFRSKHVVLHINYTRAKEKCFHYLLLDT